MLKRLVCFVLSLVCMFSVVFSSLLSVEATTTSSATKRVSNFIGMAAGKKVQDIDENLSLTKDELRFLGVYVSNFFIPFGTELGVNSEDATTQNKEDITKALQNQLNFSEELSEMFVENIIGLSRSNSQELEFRVSNKYQEGYTEVPDFKVNYFNFLRLMIGETRSVFEGYYANLGKVKENGKEVDKTPKVIKDILKSVSSDTPSTDRPYRYGYFGYDNNGEFVPMFDCKLIQNFNADGLTPSMIVFRQCLGSVDMEKGYGFSFFDFTSTEAEDSDELSGILEDMSEDALYKMSVYGTSMAVDCFGNIIMKGANHQYIAVPGCMNPYTWVNVDESGDDVKKPGYCYNLINFMGMGMADTGTLFADYSSLAGGSSQVKVTKDATNPDLKKVQVAAMSFDKQIMELSGQLNIEWGPKDSFISKIWTSGLGALLNTGNTFEKSYPLRVLRGSSEYKIGAKLFKFTDSAIKTQVVAAEKGFRKANKNDYSFYASLYDTGLDAPWWQVSKGDVTTGVKLIGDMFTTTSNGSVYVVSNTMPVIDNFIFIDNLGQFGFDNTSSKIDYSAINMEHYLDDSGSTPTKLFENWGKDSNNGFGSMYSDIVSGKMNTAITADAPAVVGVYTTYALAGLYQDDAQSKKDTIGFLGFRMNRDNMVPISNEALNIPEGVLNDMVNDTIRDWVYYILHPTKGLDYVRVLITNKVNSLLVGWHHDMVGTNSVGATTGTTLYRANTGYVTTPDLSELQWTNKLIQLYNEAVPFLIVVMVVTMLFAFISGIFTFQKSVIGVIVFSCFLMTPVSLINGVVGVSNRVSQNIYGEKFTYWALVQQESYSSMIDSAASGSDYSNYLRTLYATNTKAYNNQGSDSIVLKWQAPKKMASLMLSSGDRSLLDGLKSSFLTKSILGTGSFSGESYLDDESSYLYRSYTDIGNFSRFIYHGIKQGNKKSKTVVANNSISNLDADVKKAILNIGAGYEADRKIGYSNVNGDGGSTTTYALHTSLPLLSKMYNDAIGQKGKVSKLDIDDYVGINQDVFNFSIAMFNDSNLNFKETILANCTNGNDEELKKLLSKYNDQDLTSLAAYSLMSESPFYYFSWNLYDQGMDTGANASNGYKSLLLKGNNGDYFYNNAGNTELKDFMDMKTLFTYTIPYLKQGNDVVREWDRVYGIYVYDGVTTEEGHWNDPEIKSNKELQQKYWHNLNVARLYEIYTPWVDLMYDCSYADSETITVMGERYVVSDPLNPASYPADRPMVFSESEMVDYGLSRGDLTKAERLILDCNKGMQERMFDLLNYYNFSDATLNTAAAINCTFEFNNTFSESTLFSGNINLYPQSFEIADFSYDAFLRFILANTIGTDMTSQDDFYAEVVKNSSTTTAILMIVLDILSQYVLPAFKIFFLVAVFLGAVLLILASSCKIDPQQKFIPKLVRSLVVPMVYFLASNVGFSWVVSLFMGSGNNAVTQTDKVSISMGDPVVVMLAMAALDIGLMVIYYKIVKVVLSDLKSNFKSVAGFMGSVYGGTVAMAAKGISGVRSGSSQVGGMSGYSSGETMGTGVESPRAARRGNAKTQEDSFEEENPRVNDTKRRTVEMPNNKGKNEDAKRESINKKARAGSRNIDYDSSVDTEEISRRDRVKSATRQQDNKMD